MKTLILFAMMASCAAAQSFVQWATEIKISTVAVAGEFHVMLCAKSYDPGVADLRIKGEVTLADFQAVRIDQIFTRKTGTDSGAWKYPTCVVVATTDSPSVQVTGLEVIPTRADPIIIFVQINRRVE